MWAFRNMAEEPTWDCKITLNLPAKKKQKVSVEWDTGDLPSIPVLVNSKKISKHTKLTVYQEDLENKKKAEEKKKKEAKS